MKIECRQNTLTWFETENTVADTETNKQDRHKCKQKCQSLYETTIDKDNVENFMKDDFLKPMPMGSIWKY